MAILLMILVTAFPSLRRSSHNFFEGTHRFGGWLVLTLFWIMISLMNLETHLLSEKSLVALFFKSPLFWTHLATTILIVHPWLRTRKNLIETEHLSNHATRIHFQSCKNSIIGGGSVRVSRGLFTEYHSFAVIPASQADAKLGRSFSIIVSNAGDWTNQLIHNPPRELYLREIPALGAVSVARIFSPVVIVATGSGIGPCLGMFNQYPNHAFKIVWIVRTPIERYGEEIYKAVLNTDPNATIYDTAKNPKTSSQHIVKLAKRKYAETQAEAVVTISNKSVIDTLFLELGRADIPAFAPIFDS